VHPLLLLLRRLTSSSSVEFLSGAWTPPFFSCARRAWLMTFVAPVAYSDRVSDPVVGSLSFDVDVSHFDINQCDDGASPSPVKIKDFSGTHKCHRQTSEVPSPFRFARRYLSRLVLASLVRVRAGKWLD